MKSILAIILSSLLLISCSGSKKTWANFDQETCAKYTFGRIETRRTLTDEDKVKLEKMGIHIQEFVFENHYIGSWLPKWNSKSLEKTAVKGLKVFDTKDKLASGMTLAELQKIADSPGQSMVLLQTMATLQAGELDAFGELVFNRDHFYRIVVPHGKLIQLAEHPCIRLLNIMKDNYEPDAK